jgi:pSer/pThr/pTyr-binding forkhead associated (FHA) protein
MDNSIKGENTFLLLEIIQTGDEIALESYNEYILGRKNPITFYDTNDMSPVEQYDVDLSPFQSYEAGVSRRHASLSFGRDRVTITDLDSTNGTRLNGEIIQPFAPQDLQSGDFITLGKFKIKILIHTKINSSAA